MLVPYSTDAPVYHWPFATVGLIVANIAAFLGVAFGELGAIENWVLMYGDSFHPQQWVLSKFMHAGLMHLVGNMLFLWVFGLVIEGKLGWWRFLCCYLGIGIVQSILEQAVMLGYEGDVPGSVGASAAIFGLMAMAAVWAPMNEIQFKWFWFGMLPAGEFDVSIAVVAAFYAGFEIFMITLFGGDAGSSWLHLGGMAVGFPLGILMFQLGWVDCEGWDLFSVMRGEYGPYQKQAEPSEILAKAAARERRRDDAIVTSAKDQFARYLEQDNPAAAFKLYEKMREVGDGLQLDQRQLLTLIKWFHGEKRWSNSAPFMAELIARFPEAADPVRVKLAQICVVELGRPGKALDLLAEVDSNKFPEQQQALIKKIAARARQMQDEGVVELDVETW
jgi:membrane associated rhomboid family serine protease